MDADELKAALKWYDWFKKTYLKGIRTATLIKLIFLMHHLQEKFIEEKYQMPFSEFIGGAWTKDYPKAILPPVKKNISFREFVDQLKIETIIDILGSYSKRQAYDYLQTIKVINRLT